MPASRRGVPTTLEALASSDWSASASAPAAPAVGKEDTASRPRESSTPSAGSSRPATSASGGAAPPLGRGSIDASKFKTKLCKNFADGLCQFGENCAFVHHPEEIRPVMPDARKQSRSGNAGATTTATPSATATPPAATSPTASVAPSPFPSPLTTKVNSLVMVSTPVTASAPTTMPTSPATSLPVPRSQLLAHSAAALHSSSSSTAMPPPPPPSYDTFVTSSHDNSGMLGAYTSAGDHTPVYPWHHQHHHHASTGAEGMMYGHSSGQQRNTALAFGSSSNGARSVGMIHGVAAYSSPMESSDDDESGRNNVFVRRYRYEPYSPCDSVVYVA